MKRLLPLVLLVSCVTRDPLSVQHGESQINIGKTVAFASKTYQRIAVSKNGTFTITTRDDSEKVPIKALNVAGTYGGALIAGNLAEAISNNGSAEVINASNNAASIAAGKEVTKRAATAGAQALEAAKLAPGLP